MIIVSQNKDEFVNFENIMCVNVTDCQEDGFLIYAGFIAGRDDNYRELGYYKTEERAKEVLQEIVNKYGEYATISNISGNDIKGIYNIPKVYAMPKE